MTNIYHILNFNPKLEKDDMSPELENLAASLVKSGRIRIDAIDKINFSRFYLPYHNVSMMFSYRELNDPELLPLTEKIIELILKRTHSTANLKKEIQSQINRLRAELNKYQFVNYELEMKLARIVVQSAHPAVLMLLLLERVEIFISYSYNIADLLDVLSWQQAASNSGMQSTDGHASAVYISAGGDPFLETTKDSIFGDGFPAIARMIVIGGQEIGHFSDIIRDKKGRYISRHSADLGGRRAKETVRIGRLKDLNNIYQVRNILQHAKLLKLAEHERHLKFFKQHKRKGLVVFTTYLKTLPLRYMLNRQIHKYRLSYMYSWQKEKHLASKIVAMLDDMQFNLAPKADVYSRENKIEEEAIACIEALARVPQQVNKWGHKLVKSLWPNLYQIYYGQVIPACIKTIEETYGQKYNFSPSKPKFKLFRRLKKLFQKKPKSYSIWDY